MSTYRIVCRSHTPPIYSDSWPDDFALRSAILLRPEIIKVHEQSKGLIEVEVDNHSGPMWFLLRHPACQLEIEED